MLMHVLKLPGWPILKQLQLEEALLRVDRRNWCILNSGSDPAIVMGISGKPEQLIEEREYRANPVPVIRRFSGGGTVVVNRDTFFVTFICNTLDSSVQNFPDRVLCWSKDFYQDVFEGCNFHLNASDYSIGSKKFGGNAQYMCKGRWLHHSSLLWDYDPLQMKLLCLPPKMPAYREGRSHNEFLCCLKDHLSSKGQLEEKLLATLQAKWSVEYVAPGGIEGVIAAPHRKSTVILKDR